MILNHDIPKLSDLDKEIISHVPPGGNWQDIPEDVPSKRLEQIREMTKERGVVRTTYYGRLLKTQPSYTISTYYNRPGNGTHIHPDHDRTLTSREAARLQSFPDSYKFYGNEGKVRKQIGNAVPPLLSHAIGKKLKEIEGNSTMVDVFCGAGGLSLGLEWSGWNSLVAIDNDKEALETYKNNRKNSPVILNSDLQINSTLEACVEEIRNQLNGRQLHLMAGGPPCQGFSHAGFRKSDDMRNDLAVNYLRFAELLKPKIFLLENVEGLLTMKKGEVIRDLSKSLEEIGYRVNSPVWKLHAEQYGVPQMRRRVFLIGILNDEKKITQPPPLLNPCLGRRKKSNQLVFSENLMSPITVGEAFHNLSTSSNGQECSSDYSEWVSGRKGLSDFLNSKRITDRHKL
ncbi:DNA (cytosine-5-)-methyltransferase [Ekhidna sp.]|uniref:DNA (cytosine-5-)-methyltransferase n=1 Tax=Ekhidna sp. TaxID=2608089 RepID=UPI003B5072DC